LPALLTASTTNELEGIDRQQSLA
jgi:hypothetical protein